MPRQQSAWSTGILVIILGFMLHQTATVVSFENSQSDLISRACLALLSATFFLREKGESGKERCFVHLRFSVVGYSYSCLFPVAVISLDQLGRARQQIRVDRQADLLGRLEIDNELKPHRLLHRQVFRFGALQYPVHVICDSPVAVREVSPVVYESSGIYGISTIIHRRQPAL